MAKKIINSGKIYIDEALLKASRPITQKDTRGADRKFYEIDLNTANASGGDSIYTADGSISDFQRTVDMGTGNTLIFDFNYSVYGKTILEIRNQGNQQASIGITEYDAGVYQRGVTYSSSAISNAGSGGAGTSSGDDVFNITSFFTGSNAGVRLESYANGTLTTLTLGANGAVYPSDYTSKFVDRSLPDKAYVDSYTGEIKRTVVEIGDWDMDANQTTTVAHGLTFSKIRNVEGVIRNDANNIFYSSGYIGASGNVQWTTTTIDATNVTLTRRPGGGGGVFDDPAFSTTPFNRGWLIIDYVD